MLHVHTNKSNETHSYFYFIFFVLLLLLVQLHALAEMHLNIEKLSLHGRRVAYHVPLVCKRKKKYTVTL